LVIGTVFATGLDLFMPPAAESVNNKIQIKNEAGNRSRPAPFGQAPLLNLPAAIPASGNQQPIRQDSPTKKDIG